MSLTGAQLEGLALQAITRFPHLVAETGLEWSDFGDETRQVFFRALGETRAFLPNGQAAALEVAKRAGIVNDLEWVQQEFRLALRNEGQARDWAMQLRRLSLGQSFAAKVREKCGALKGIELVREVAQLAQATMNLAAGGDEVTDMETVSLRFIEAEMRRLDEGVALGHSTGLPTLDKALRGGWRNSELTTLVAVGGAGKSTLTEFWRLALAKQGIYSLTFAGEMSEEQAGERIVYAECSTPMNEEIRNIADLDNAYHRIRVGQVLRYMLLDAKSRFPEAYVRSVIETQKRKRGGLGLVVIDHLRHLKVEGVDKTDYAFVSEGAAMAKRIAKDCKVPVCLVTHMNNQAAAEMRKQGGGEPDFGMIRGSGRIFEESDALLCLWRPEQLATLHVLKARQSGMKGTKIPLLYDVRTQSFGEAR